MDELELEVLLTVRRQPFTGYIVQAKVNVRNRSYSFGKSGQEEWFDRKGRRGRKAYDEEPVRNGTWEKWAHLGITHRTDLQIQEWILQQNEQVDDEPMRYGPDTFNIITHNSLHYVLDLLRFLMPGEPPRPLPEADGYACLKVRALAGAYGPFGTIFRKIYDTIPQRYRDEGFPQDDLLFQSLFDFRLEYKLLVTDELNEYFCLLFVKCFLCLVAVGLICYSRASVMPLITPFAKDWPAYTVGIPVYLLVAPSLNLEIHIILMLITLFLATQRALGIALLVQVLLSYSWTSQGLSSGWEATCYRQISLGLSFLRILVFDFTVEFHQTEFFLNYLVGGLWYFLLYDNVEIIRQDRVLGVNLENRRTVANFILVVLSGLLMTPQVGWTYFPLFNFIQVMVFVLLGYDAVMEHIELNRMVRDGLKLLFLLAMPFIFQNNCLDFLFCESESEI